MKRPQAWLADDFAPPARPDTALEARGYAKGFTQVAGLDEVGRGPWAGPVVAAAVIMPRGLTHPDIRDSKMIPAPKRDDLARWVKQEAVAWAIGIVAHEEIDRINILKASLMAMSIAFGRLNPRPDLLLIDGSHTIPMPFLLEQQSEDDGVLHRQSRQPRIFAPFPSGLPRQTAIVKGDAVCHSIAAASIIAKVARDQIMTEMDQRYPSYGFAQHKGYGSEAHAEALKRLGPSPIHRRSYRPVWRAFNSSRQAPAPLFDK
jgi:ribonuclease HII